MAVREDDKMEEIAGTVHGYAIYVEENEVGGHRYFSDEIGGGVFVWDTALVSIETLELVLQIEKSRQ